MNTLLMLLALSAVAPAKQPVVGPGLMGSPLHLSAGLGINWYDDWNQSLDPSFSQLRPAYSGELTLSAPEYFGGFAVKGQFDLDLRHNDTARRAQVGLYYGFGK